jgi:hypothetical protein
VDEANYLGKDSKLYEVNFKGLFSPPPLGKENFLGLLNQQYIKYIFCQYKNEIVKIIFLRIITRNLA